MSPKEKTRSPSARQTQTPERFADLAGHYVELYAKTAQQVLEAGRGAWWRSHLLPRWGKMKASAISRADVRAVMVRIEAPIVANQTLAAASGDLHLGGAGRRSSPSTRAAGVDRNPTSDRERVLSDARDRLAVAEARCRGSD